MSSSCSSLAITTHPRWGTSSASRGSVKRLARRASSPSTVIRAASDTTDSSSASSSKTKKTTTTTTTTTKTTTTATKTHAKPKVAVVGAGWGGFGAAKALCEAGCEVTLLDGIPDPTGATPSLTPTGKPFEYGTRGFWKDYPNIEATLAEFNIS